MQKHFARKFNSDLPNDLGMTPGKKRIIMLFKINKVGDIVDIRAKAPHPKLQKEAIRIVKLLPKMKPGRQRGKAVGVKYALPMTIEVEA
jgi:protein TonB